MKLYLAGPMSGLPEFNFPAFDAAAYRLRNQGHEVISPADLDRQDGFDPSGATGFEVLSLAFRERFARNDLQALLEVDAVALLPGWQDSTGARNEVRIACWLGLPLLDADTLDQILVSEVMFSG